MNANLRESIESGAKEVGGVLVQKTTLLLILSVIVNVFFTFMILAFIAFAYTELGIAVHKASLIASALCLLLFAVFYFKLTNKMNSFTLNKEFQNTKDDIQDSILDMKEKTLESLQPMNLVKSNPQALVAGTFIAGLGLALLTSKLTKGENI